MTVAFAQFDESLAWLIRGLVMYGWVDITRTRIPPAGSFGGFDLSLIPDSQGRRGVSLHVPAVSGGSRCHEDETYTFEVVIATFDTGPGFAVRCAECNFIQEFAFDPIHPDWIAGYIHQALTTYVPGYVQWRLGGGELTWAQRQGVPEVQGEPCSASLASWIGQQLMANRTFDQTLWEAPVGSVAVAGAAAGQAPIAPIARAGNFDQGTGTPVASAQGLVKRPAAALGTVVYFGGLTVMGSGINVLLTLYMFKLERMFALVSNLAFIVVFGSLGVAAWFGVRQYKKVEGKLLPWIAMLYVASIPTCCLIGIPVSAWAAKVWLEPRVRLIRSAQR